MPKILIVDDELANREALRDALADENPDWEFCLAGSCSEGVAAVHAALDSGLAVDVLLTDLIMEDDRSGMRLLEQCRQLDPTLMAILFTAKEKSVDRYAAFEIGAFDVIDKNIPGISAAREINVKTRAAVKYREWSRHIQFVSRYFDPKLYERIRRNPEFLQLTTREVTICFWDIRGFSALTEHLKSHPPLIAGFLRDYCDLAAQVIFAHGGMVDKFIGDGVMALFGVTGDDASEDAATSAVAAAIALREKFTPLLDAWTQKWVLYTAQSIDIGLGCGIHAGSAMVGNVGTSFRDQFTALGADVNLAARIEARAQKGQILISQSTEARVRSQYHLNEKEALTDLKNIAGRFRVFEVL